jgi:predicted ester cyclase
MSAGRKAAIDKLIASDFIGHLGAGSDIVGLEKYKTFPAAVFAAFPDGESIVEKVVAERDKVAARWTFRGTHKGEFLGIAPTGRYVAYTTTAIYRIAGGKIVEIRGDTDNLGLLRQLGARLS